MSIRPAVLDDVPQIVALGRKLHALSSYADMPFDDEKVATLMRALIAGNGVVFVSLSGNEQINGGIAGGVAEFWFNRVVHGFDFSFFIEPETRHGTTALRLLLAFEAWCRIKGATEVRLGITTALDVAGTTRFYEWAGYRQNGVMFIKGIENGN